MHKTIAKIYQLLDLIDCHRGELPDLDIGGLESQIREELTIGVTLIEQEDLDDLKNRDRWLDALDEAGVDNWEGISEAHAIFSGDAPE